MSPRRLFQIFFFRLLAALVVALLGDAAMAQADPPGRVARLNHMEGSTVFSPAGDNEWTDAELNRPLTRGDRLWTDRGSRAEIQIGSSAVRMDGRTHLEILVLDDQSAQLSVTQGTVNIRVRSLPEGENFEIDTPNLAYRAAYPGDYRIDVDGASGTTRITIHSGTGAVYGENGQALPLGGGQQVTFRARALARVNAQEAPPQDSFDRWATERNRLEDQSISARYVPREVVGYQQLDAHGQWAQDATHGMVWYPRGTAANWAPYRHGHWESISPWGWTWIDDAPWGFAPFHYGRWALVDSRWAWVPGHLGLHPLYAPALVAFVGSGGSGASWKVSLGSGRPGVAWFPLGPGEAWQPGYRASPVYISNVNRHIAVQDNASYAHQRHAEALTAVSAEDFHRGRPVRAGIVSVAANTLTKSQVVPPPPMPEGSGGVAHQRATPAHVVPPASAEFRQVITKGAPDQPQAAQAAQAQAAKVQVAQAQAQQEADAQRARRSAEQQKSQTQQVQAAEEQAKVKPAPKHAEAPKPAQQPTAAAAAAIAAKAAQRSKEQVKREELAKRAEQARRDQVAEQAGQAKHERQAKRAEQAKRDQVAARAEQNKREQIAARAEQAKRDQIAVRAEQARREQVAVRAEQAKRAQLARRVEQSKAESRAEQVRQQAKREHQIKREQLAGRAEQSRREAKARRVQQERSEAQARRDEQLRREAHALRVEQARRTADRDAEVLREQRVRREEQARREEQERERAAQREALQRQQQALADQHRRDQQLWERQQRDRVRQRPDLREDRRAPPEVWQRGIPILNPGRTS